MLMVDTELDSGLNSKTKGSSLLEFCKMQALGNDFVLVSEEALALALRSLSSDSSASGSSSKSVDLKFLARLICARQFSIGADGLIIVRRGSRLGSLAWTYINSDGSSSAMCGNGLRCLALWSEKNGRAPSKSYMVETGKGPVQIVFESEDSITSDLGEPFLRPALIPVDSIKESIVGDEFQLDSELLNISCVGMGNPHCIIFEHFDYNNTARQEKLAAKLQSHKFFPEGVNVEFVNLKTRNELSVLVYERGCGRTLACASGAAAVAVAGVLNGLTERKVIVQLEGGSLEVEWSNLDNHVRICGKARHVFSGSIDLQSLNWETASW